MLIIGTLLFLVSCASEVRDIEEYRLSIVPTGSGFACVLDGDAPDEWLVTGSSGEDASLIRFVAVDDRRVEFEPFEAGYRFVTCTALYPEGNLSATLRVVSTADSSE